ARVAEVVGEALGQALAGRRVLLVGESAGGLVAMAVAGAADAGPVRAVLACDPSMTTAKQWRAAASFQDLYRRESDNAVARQYGRDTFGVSPDGVEEIIYYPLVG